MRALVAIVIGSFVIGALAFALPTRECPSSAASVEALFAPCLAR